MAPTNAAAAITGALNWRMLRAPPATVPPTAPTGPGLVSSEGVAPAAPLQTERISMLVRKAKCIAYAGKASPGVSTTVVFELAL